MSIHQKPQQVAIVSTLMFFDYKNIMQRSIDDTPATNPDNNITDPHTM